MDWRNHLRVALAALLVPAIAIGLDLLGVIDLGRISVLVVAGLSAAAAGVVRACRRQLREESADAG